MQEKVFLYKPAEGDEQRWYEGTKNCVLYGIYGLIGICLLMYLCKPVIGIKRISELAANLITHPERTDVFLFVLIVGSVVYLVILSHCIPSFVGLWKYNTLKPLLPMMQFVVRVQIGIFLWCDGKEEISFNGDDVKSWKSYSLIPHRVKRMKDFDAETKLAFSMKDVLILDNGKRITLYRLFNPEVHSYLETNRLQMRLPEPEYKEIRVVHKIGWKGRVKDVETTIL